MQKIKKVYSPVIEKNHIQELENSLWAELGLNPVYIVERVYSSKERYLALIIEDIKGSIDFIDDIFDKPMKDRIFLDDPKTASISITNEEFLYLYNKYVLKNSQNVIKDIKILYQNDGKLKKRHYNIDIPLAFRSMCKDIKHNLRQFFLENFYSFNSMDYYINIPDDNPNEVSIYVVYKKDVDVQKYLKKLEKSLNLQNPPDNYELDRNTMVYQYDLTLDHLKNIYIYLKLLST